MQSPTPIRFLLLVYLVLSGCSSFSQKRDQFELFAEKNYLGFHFDDDFLFLGNRDEQYTGGLEFEYIRKLEKKKPVWGLFNPFKNGQRYFTSSFGSYLYTPYNVSDSLIILNDRPFSSYMYTTLGYTAYDINKKRKVTFDFFFGIMGSPFPGEIQDLIHTVGESPPTSGWSNRLICIETFIPNFRINYQQHLFTFGEIGVSPIDWIRVSQVYELNAGFYNNNISGGLKISVFKRPPWVDHQSTLNAGNRERKRNITLSGYFLPQIQFVAHNTSLQGLAWIPSAYSISEDMITPMVWSLKAGLNMQIRKMHISYVIQARSKEFKEYARSWHTWAGITFGFSF